jgi:uncharacterized membrane protein YccC
MLVASVVGYLLHDPVDQMLVTVGAFLGTISAIMPHNRSRLLATAVTSLAQIVAAALGALCSGHWAIVFPVIFAMFLISGLLRAVAMGISIRTTVVTIVFLAFAEISSTLSVSTLRMIGFFTLGFVILNLAQLLPPYGSRHSAQRRAVSALYRTIAAGAPADPALLAADRSLALLRRHRHRELDRLAQLVSHGEEIAQLLTAFDEDDHEQRTWCDVTQHQLQEIAPEIARARPSGQLAPAAWPTEPGNDLERALVRAVDDTTRLAAGGDVPPVSDERSTPTSFELVRDELRWGSPVLHHALRLAIASVLGQVIGMGVGALLGADAFLAGHGFWVVVAAALIVFPDYGMTFSRGIGRSAGTIAGAVLGVLIALLPLSPLLHTIVLFVLFCGYLVFRSSGQPYTMFWVVAWIGSLTAGPLGATTRGLDTIIGCLLAFAAYLIAPTWQRRLLTERLTEWARAAARHLDALVLLWNDDDEEHRLDVSHSVLRARVTRVELATSAQSARVEPRDRHGRWEDDALEAANAGVTAVTRHIAALSALVPLTSAEDRALIGVEVERASHELRAIAGAEAPPAAEEGSRAIASRLAVQVLECLRGEVDALADAAARAEGPHEQVSA